MLLIKTSCRKQNRHLERSTGDAFVPPWLDANSCHAPR